MFRWAINLLAAAPAEPAVVPFLPASLRQGQGGETQESCIHRETAEKKYRKNAMIDKLMCLIKTQVDIFLFGNN